MACAAQEGSTCTALPVFSESHNAAVQAITDRFVGRGVRPGGVNGSALHAVRSNEFSFGEVFNFEYDLREFRLSPTTGRLVPVALDRTPDLNLSFSFALSDYVAANRDAILAGTHTVPDQFQGLPFRAGAIRNGGDQVWTTSIPEADAETRHAFAINTCNGCHSPDETGTFFQHLSSFELSPFLIGVTVDDPISHAPRSYNDLLRRRLDLEAIVCPAEPTVSLRHGISRVH